MPTDKEGTINKIRSKLTPINKNHMEFVYGKCHLLITNIILLAHTINEMYNQNLSI